MKTTVVLEISLKNTLAFWDCWGYLIFVAILYKRTEGWMWLKLKTSFLRNRVGNHQGHRAPKTFVDPAMSRSKKLGNFQGRVVLIWWIQRASGSMCDLVFHPTLRDDTQASHTVPSGCIFVGKKTSCLSSNRIHHPSIYHCNIWMDGLWHCFKNIESLFHLLQTCGRFISPFLGKSPRVCCEAQISKLEEAPQRGILPAW